VVRVKVTVRFMTRRSLRDADEALRFTIADNPGLIEDASDNFGLGHSFLRSMERSLALIYVVDIFGPAHWDELLREEPEKYKTGMSSKRERMAIASKANILAAESDPEEVRLTWAKFALVEELVRDPPQSSAVKY
jgi:GTP-binding protein